jgi:formylglycine-generating enzyme required for sulfatase activity/lipoprotein NlpI
MTLPTRISTLSRANYEALGRIKGSIEAAIERAFKVADADPAIPNDRVARLALLRRGLIPWLAGLDPDTGTARRRVARLSEIPAEARPLIQHLVEQRLLSTDLAKETGESTIEPAHEALLRQWGLLQGWLTEDAGLLAVLEGVKRASRDWVANNRDTPWLAHTSDRLAAAERLTARPDLAANLEPTDRQYITACREAEATAKARRRRAQTAVYVMLLGIIVGLVGWINQSYLQEQWRWYSASRPFMNTKVQPYVLTGEAEHALKPLQSFKECSKEEGRDYCPEMIVVPAGIFMMGSSQTDKNAYGKEQPQHNVTINKPFAVSEFELTFDEWDACVAYGDCARNISDSGFGRGKRPVINVVRDEAQRYVAWLARTTGKPYRLLTEAEYEYATRAGTLTAYPWGNDIGTNNSTCGGCGSQWDNTETAPVGSFAANGFGLYDMVGNAWEWVEDCYHPNYDRAPTDGSAWTTTCPDDHRGVVRGGSWAYTPATLRSAYRFSVGTDYRSVDVGFRVARTLDLAALTLTEQQIDQMKQQDLCNNVLSSDLQIAGCTTLINSGKVNSNDLASVYVNRGKAYRRKGDYDSAVADYNQAIMLDPKYVQAYLGRGAAYDGKKDYTHAVADFSQAITLDPKNADAFSARCWNEAITVQLPTVLTDCNQAVALQPGNADFLDSRGFTYLKLGQYANAVADYTAALKINPKLAYSLYGRGFAETKSGNAADGDKDIAAAKAIDANIANEFADWGVN